MADGKVLPYLDVPFQHASPAVLKRMRRPAAQEETLERYPPVAGGLPGLTIRSTFIVGFPGETEEDFAALSTGSARRTRSRRLFPLRACRRRGGERSRRAGSRALKAERQAPPDASQQAFRASA